MKQFDSYSIFNLLNSHIQKYAAKIDPAFNTQNGGWLETIGNFFGRGWRNIQDSVRELTGENQERLQNWINIIGNPKDLANAGINQEAIRGFAGAMTDLFTALNYLNHEAGNPQAEQRYYDALEKVYTSINNETVQGNPALAKYIGQKYQEIWKTVPEYFAGISPTVLNRNILINDPFTGKEVSINKDSVSVKAESTAMQQATARKTQQQITQEVNAKVMNGELTPEQGAAIINQQKLNRLNRDINRLLIGFERLNPEQRKNRLQQVNTLLENSLADADFNISDEQYNALRDKIDNYGVRFNVEGFKDRAFANKFGDLSSNEVYKNDRNKAWSAYQEYKKIDPSLSFDDFITQKIYGGKDVDPKVRYRRLVQKARQLSGLNMKVGYDDEEGVMYVGDNTMGKGAYNKIPMSRSDFNRIMRGGVNNVEERIQMLVNAGLDEDSATKLALTGGTKIFTTSSVTGTKYKGYKPSIQSWNIRYNNKSLDDILAMKGKLPIATSQGTKGSIAINSTGPLKEEGGDTLYTPDNPKDISLEGTIKQPIK